MAHLERFPDHITFLSNASLTTIKTFNNEPYHSSVINRIGSFASKFLNENGSDASRILEKVVSTAISSKII